MEVDTTPIQTVTDIRAPSHFPQVIYSLLGYFYSLPVFLMERKKCTK